MPHKPRHVNAVTRRLQSRLHQKAIAAVAREEAAGEACDRLAKDFGTRLIALLPVEEGRHFAYHRFIELARQFWPAVSHEIHDRLRSMQAWSHDTTVRLILECVPPHWFRHLVPRLPLPHRPVTEAIGTTTAAPAGDDDDQTPINAPSPGPIQGRLPDEEWQQIVRDVLFPPKSAQAIASMIYAPAADGTGWPERLAKWSRQFADPDKLAHTITVGLSQGEALPGLAKMIRHEYQVAGSTARRVARSEAHRVNLISQRDSFAGLGDLMTGQMYQAQLDFNTRPWHAIHHGQVFENGEPLPETLDEPNCRCSTIPVLSEPESLATNEPLAAEFANAAEQEIPDPSAYSEWFSRASEPEKRLAVGGVKYRTVRDLVNREPEWTDFLDHESGQLLSLKQIKDESPAERHERKALVDRLIAKRAADYKSVRNVGFLMQRHYGG